MFVVDNHHQFPLNLQKKFDHGTKYEVNATAMLISIIVPAYLPACYSFYEVGPTLIHTAEGKKLLEVSADGVLQCSLGRDCPNYSIHRDRCILIEIKSSVPQENIAETIFYDVLNRYVPQVQSQLKAYGCEELWLICSTAISATVICVYFDNNLWNEMWNLVVEFYSPDKPNVPTCLHPSIKQLKLQISNSKKTHTSFMCEVPTITGEFGALTIPSNFTSPYAPAPARCQILKTNERITQENYLVHADAKSAFTQCHEVLRDLGRELLVFMLTDKDRKQTNNIPYSYPVTYALKGTSMTNKHLEYLVKKVRNELLQRKILVMCEVYDGQWHKFITEDRKGNRLMKLHGRDNWNRVSNLSKDKCLEEINAVSSVKKSAQETISALKLDKLSTATIQNIVISKGAQSELSLETTGKKMAHIHSVHPLSRPDLYIKNKINGAYVLSKNAVVIEEEKYLREEDGFKVKRRRKYECVSIFARNRENNFDEGNKCESKRIRMVGLQENEKSLLDVVRPAYANGNEENEETDDIVKGQDPQNNTPISLEDYLKSDNSSILHNILNELRNVNVKKWEGKSIDDLFPNFLTYGQVLMEETTVKELNIIVMELRCSTGHVWCSSNMIKAEIVNEIVKAFGSNRTVVVERKLSILNLWLLHV